jgi:hypothetical protein
MKYVLYALLAWFLYQFIFKFLVPVWRASRQIKKGFREMKSRMEQHQQQQSYAGAGPGSGTNSTASASGGTFMGGKTSKPHGEAEDYIDFEEVK